ncbi:MAG: hypothetical protein ACI9GW_003235 [Halieaceae bacterium]|jgi:hypothetical protein
MEQTENPLAKMAETTANQRRFKAPVESDWRIVFGLIVSSSYLLLMILYVSHSVGWSNFYDLPVQLMGNFLEGAFAPLAFLWLVIGYFLQKKELAQNTEAMKMQFIEIQKSASQAERQTESIAASEVHQRRESFLRIAEAVNRQLGSIIGLLFISSQSAEGNTEKVSPEEMSSMWATIGTENHEVFSRALLRVMLLGDDRYRFKVLFGTPIRTRHTENFMFNFERMMKSARDCDEEGIIADALTGNAHGFVYNRIQSALANVPEGIIMGVYDFDPDSRD